MTTQSEVQEFLRFLSRDAKVPLKYTLPNQPLSSRLSLAQAAMSMYSRTKAINLGNERGNSAEEEGWGQGQPFIRVMGREIKVLKRWGYDPKDDNEIKDFGYGLDKLEETQNTVEAEKDSLMEAADGSSLTESTHPEPALWGLDLEALHSPKKSTKAGRSASGNPTLPIYTPQSAREYLMHSFSTGTPLQPDMKWACPGNPTASAMNAEYRRNSASLLRALDLLFDSWAHVLSKEMLDLRVRWWYANIKPEVKNGVAGWGERGNVRLARILDLRRRA